MFKLLLDHGLWFFFFRTKRNIFFRPLSDNEKCQNLTSCLNINETRREIIVNCKTSTTRFFNYDHVTKKFHLIE